MVRARKRSPAPDRPQQPDSGSKPRSGSPRRFRWASARSGTCTVRWPSGRPAPRYPGPLSGTAFSGCPLEPPQAPSPQPTIDLGTVAKLVSSLGPLREALASRPDPRKQTPHQLLPRKEVIQPQLPLRLPCYDFVPITSPTFDTCLEPCLQSPLAQRLQVLPAFMT